jgi:hypothetical protein
MHLFYTEEQDEHAMQTPGLPETYHPFMKRRPLSLPQATMKTAGGQTISETSWFFLFAVYKTDKCDFPRSVEAPHCSVPRPLRHLRSHGSVWVWVQVRVP